MQQVGHPIGWYHGGEFIFSAAGRRSFRCCNQSPRYEQLCKIIMIIISGLSKNNYDYYAWAVTKSF